MPTLFLASASPRRAELLGQIAVPFQRVSASIDETPREAEEPAAYVERLALEKAQAGLQQLQQDAGAVVLGADTAVVLDGRILGKPQDRADAIHDVSAAAIRVARNGGPGADIRDGLTAQWTERGAIVQRIGPCTYEDRHYFSHRRDGVTGRQAGVIAWT